MIRDRRARRMGAVLVALVVVVVALAGCGGDDGAAPPETTAPTLPDTTTTTLDERGAEVLDAYRAFWNAFLAAADPPDPEHPDLERHATGEQLATLREAFLARRSAGEAIRGSVELAPVLVSLADGEAVVRDCYLDETGVYDVETGERKDTPTGERYLVRATLVLDGGAWKVASLAREDTGCVPEA